MAYWCAHGGPRMALYQTLNRRFDYFFHLKAAIVFQAWDSKAENGIFFITKLCLFCIIKIPKLELKI